MKHICDLRDRFLRELEEIGSKNDMNKSDAEFVYYLASAVKNLNKILEFEDGYSNTGASYSYGNDVRWNGRFGDGNIRGRYSQGWNGYSRDNGGMVFRLEQIASEAPNDQIRNDIHQLIEKIKST